jgi:predicted transcriptional regulator
MEINLSPDQETRLNEMAARTGRMTEEVVREALNRFLEFEDQLTRDVEAARASIRRGEFFEHDEVVARIEKRFRS